MSKASNYGRVSSGSSSSRQLTSLSKTLAPPPSSAQRLAHERRGPQHRSHWAPRTSCRSRSSFGLDQVVRENTLIGMLSSCSYDRAVSSWLRLVSWVVGEGRERFGSQQRDWRPLTPEGRKTRRTHSHRRYKSGFRCVTPFLSAVSCG